jgi:hypothetical protein
VLDVADHEKITRTIAVDRTRKIGFLYAQYEQPTDRAVPGAEPNLPQTRQPSEPVRRPAGR